MTQPLARATLAPGLEISRVVTGLWQMADQERDGRAIDLDALADVLVDYAQSGFDSFDMADHYGSAELVAGRAAARLVDKGLRAPAILTKWVPESGPMTPEIVRGGVQHALDRLGLECLDLLQFHWWDYKHPGYLDAMAELMRLREEGLIKHLGVTNFDTAHLRVLVKNGIEIATNQVCFSLLDRRAAGGMTDFCLEHGIQLLAFGTLGGGFLSERWLVNEPPAAADDWSKMKYRRYIDAAGGWGVFQGLLRTLAKVAERRGASIANVATRWVLEQPAVAAVIVGARLGERDHRANNRRLFSFRLDADDIAEISQVLAALTPIEGDCGDEYRKPPFLTASGDLSHHLENLVPAYPAVPIGSRPARRRVDTGSASEAACGYSRAVRAGDRILVSGTTATHGAGEVVCPGDVEGQTTHILDKIEAAISALGGSIDDVIRTRIYMKDASRWQEAANAHGRVFRDVLPANTLIEIKDLVGDYEVEIEAEAVIST
ncbi:MAG: aldo/keto reductase [Alphaproteobacteria bacterium]|nr:aldo/keto reductase [Alphaproteobacteria bacterium]